MNNLLKDAIADAKAVKDIAIANATAAMTEAFLPKVQSMLSAKLQEDDDEEEDNEGGNEFDDLDFSNLGGEGEEEPAIEPAPEPEGGEEAPAPEPAPEPEPAEGEEQPVEAPEEDEEDKELESIIRELEDDETEDDSMTPEEELTTEDEDVNLDEVIEALKTLNNEGEEDNADSDYSVKDVKRKSMSCEIRQLRKENAEFVEAITTLRKRMNEVNLLNSKLLYVTKLFRKVGNLTEAQKRQIVETVDRATTVREAKLIYATIAEQFSKAKPAKKITESIASASKATGATKKIIEKPEMLSESVLMLQRRAGLL